MLFGTAQFAIFLAALLGLLRLLPRRSWNGVLLGASLVFYTLWIPSYLLLLLADIGVNYALLQGMLAAPPGSRRRRGYLIASIVFTVGLLLYFKYAVFLLSNALPALQALFDVSFELPSILLPLGISFYSFQIISLTVDCYRAAPDDSSLPIDNLGRYALYIAFFPQLIAGPILRGSELLPQLEAGCQPTSDRARRGIWLLASGAAKKLILADFLLAPLAAEIFGAPGIANASFHWIALYAFAFQIYFDFSGYTDLARGTALLIGLELPENFREPYLSRSPQEFWQRWHITLSRWLQVYLFVPISRGIMKRADERWDALAVALAQLVTMSLCGLWHGAGWSFVLWGLLQGFLLVAWPFGRRLRPGEDPDRVGWRDAPMIALFFHTWCITLVFFRAANVEDALGYLQALFVPGNLAGWPVLEAITVAACVGLHLGERWLRPRRLDLLCKARDLSWAIYAEALVLGILAGAAVLAAGAGGEFIYFQF
jgi:alginate O-acetyltransferase complex protein AlgI